MNELDLLKKDWKRQEDNFPQLGYDEIYTMIHKKSSSIVKWLLIICVAELVFWSGITLFFPENSFGVFEELQMTTFIQITYVIYYLVLFGFIYLFYRNYKRISVISNTKTLMKNILTTRKTVKYYIFFNIGGFVLLSVLMNVFFLLNPDALITYIENTNNQEINVDPNKIARVFIIVHIITIIIVSGFIWLLYRIIYGILLKRLIVNYKELEKLEV